MARSKPASERTRASWAGKYPPGWRKLAAAAIAERRHHEPDGQCEGVPVDATSGVRRCVSSDAGFVFTESPDLHVIHLDRNTQNVAPGNMAAVCSWCEREWKRPDRRRMDRERGRRRRAEALEAERVRLGAGRQLGLELQVGLPMNLGGHVQAPPAPQPPASMVEADARERAARKAPAPVESGELFPEALKTAQAPFGGVTVRGEGPAGQERETRPIHGPAGGVADGQKPGR